MTSLRAHLVNSIHQLSQQFPSSSLQSGCDDTSLGTEMNSAIDSARRLASPRLLYLFVKLLLNDEPRLRSGACFRGVYGLVESAQQSLSLIAGMLLALVRNHPSSIQFLANDQCSS
jgi:hypothetical protein